MLTRRELLARGAWVGAAGLLAPGCARVLGRRDGVYVNDVHSQLNRTRVLRIVRPESLGGCVDAVRSARSEGRALSIAAGRHAMGGQQFGTDTVLVDASGLDSVLEFDRTRGEIEVGAGIQWPALVDHLLREQAGSASIWGIVQKQTGADRLSIGGALAANAHGRGLAFRPLVQDVEAFTLVDAGGEPLRCSRSENAELFRLAIGGYGMFGLLASVRLRLAPRRKLERVVELCDVDDLPARFQRRIDEGFLYGDFQYSTDLASEAGLLHGVFSCYRPVADSTPIREEQRELSEDDWRELLLLAHQDRARAFEVYAAHYRATSGQVYWSDTHQMSTYVDDYHRRLAGRLGELANGSEMISEIYVPRDALPTFFADVRRDFLEHRPELIYGTVRLIERDGETALPWAREPFACVIFNLHTAHDEASLARTARHFQRLIDLGLRRGGSYFLTYHRWARREQVSAAYPELPQVLREKRRLDPEQRFQSDWYRHYRDLLL